MTRQKTDPTASKLTATILIVVLLALCLCVTSFALVLVSVSVPDNTFRTGHIEINLNDGNPVIEEHEFLFEPGMTVKKSFFIENLSTWDVYYKIYFDDVKGGLASVLQITIAAGDTVLFQGTAPELSRANVPAADDTLQPGERRALSICFHYPESAGNATQNSALSFTLCAEAVQTKNNPDKLFD